MIHFSLLITLFSMLPVTFAHAGNAPETRTFVLTHNFNGFEPEMLRIDSEKSMIGKARTLEEKERVRFLASMRGETPNTKVNKNDMFTQPRYSTKNSITTFKYTPAPSNRNHAKELEEISTTIWNHLFTESNTNFQLTRNDLVSYKTSLLEVFNREEISNDDIKIIDRMLTEMTGFLYPTAQELAAKAAHILTMADEIADEGLDPSDYLEYEQEKVEQECLLEAKFTAFMKIYEQMTDMKSARDL